MKREERPLLAVSHSLKSSSRREREKIAQGNPEFAVANEGAALGTPHQNMRAP